jgi:glycosyltransferase involved in cell wall biosynthesis
MKVSVVLCSYTLDMWEHLQDAVDSVRQQTHDSIEIIVVVDGNEQLCERVRSKYGDLSDVTIHCNEQNQGLSTSRNTALEYATGDVVAFLDDDAVADETWLEELVSVYESRDAVAVGGKMVGDWVAGKPSFLPSEFYWLVGVTHRGFAEPGEEVRNTFGSNISFRREVFEEIGKFDPELGRHGSLNIQAEETMFCLRMREHFSHGVVYNPDAVVAHKIFDYRTDPKWLLERAFWQGYSKRVMEQLIQEGGDNETAFLKQLLGDFIPSRCRGLMQSPTAPKAMQLLSIVVLTAVVGLGYGYGVWTELVS